MGKTPILYISSCIVDSKFNFLPFLRTREAFLYLLWATYPRLRALKESVEKRSPESGTSAWVQFRATN